MLIHHPLGTSVPLKVTANHDVETGGLLIDSFTVSVSKDSVHVSETTLTFYAIYIAWFQG